MRARTCGLLETPNNFFIDHLAPLCAMTNAPILSSHLNTLLFYQNYYPHVQIVLKKLSLSYMMENYESVIYSFNPEPSFQTLIQEGLKKHPTVSTYSNTFRFIFHFHGCSDKGYHCQWMDPNGHFKDIDLLFLYGKRMTQILKDKALYHLPKNIVEIGNYRYAYYKEFQSFFDQKVEQDVFSKFQQRKPIVLYAPTWDDLENSSSFAQVEDSVLKAIAKDFNLLIKLHPNMTLQTERYDPTPVVDRLNHLKHYQNTLILPFYPLTYPLIQRCDVFLGDHSSVGYDVLPMKKPMVFLNPLARKLSDPSALLFNCGTQVSSDDFHNLDKILKNALKENKYKKKIEELDHFAFGASKSYKTIQRNVCDSIDTLLDG